MIGSLGVTSLKQGELAAQADPKWEKDIAAFEATDRTDPPPTNANGSNSGILRVEEAAGEREVMRGSRDSHRCE